VTFERTRRTGQVPMARRIPDPTESTFQLLKRPARIPSHPVIHRMGHEVRQQLTTPSRAASLRPQDRRHEDWRPFLDVGRPILCRGAVPTAPSRIPGPVPRLWHNAPMLDIR